MNTPQKPTIIVGVDGSDSSVEALRRALWLAESLGAQVTALGCWDYPSAFIVPYPLGNLDFKGAAQETLDAAVESAFGPERPQGFKAKLVHGGARSILIEASSDATLLVLGRRGLGGFRGLLMGSVSSACIAHAHCPVLIVQAPKTAEHHKWAGGLRAGG